MMRWTLLGVALAVAAVLSVACSRKSAPGNGPAVEAEPITARGTVRRLGSELDVRTVIQGEEAVVVLGDYADEIGRVAGAEVWVSGAPATSPYGRAIDAAQYRILSVDGDIPIVGVLGEDDDGFFLARDDGSRVRVDVTERLADALGAKIWVILGPDDVTVARYGILRD